MALHLPAPRWRDQAIVLVALLVAAAAWHIAGGRRAGGGGCAPVVVYLANETRHGREGARNAAIVEGWLRASGDAQAVAAAGRLALDREVFPQVVDAAVEALARSDAPSWFVATNKTVRDGYVLFRRDRGPVQRQPFSALPATGDVVRDESPLATRAGMARALTSARGLFPRHQHELVVLLKSHGGGDLVATPRLTVRHELSSAEDVVARVRGERRPDTVVDGIRRAELLDVLRQLGVPVRLLVLESCGAGAGLVAGDLPPNVRAIAAAAGTLDYAGLDLGSLGDEPDRELVRQIEAHPRLQLVRRPRGGLPWAMLPVVAVLALLVRCYRGDKRTGHRVPSLATSGA